MKQHMAYLLEGAYRRIAFALKYQVMDAASPEYGAIPMSQQQYPQAKSTIYRIAPAICCYVDPESKFFQDQKLYGRIRLALAYVARKQRPSGCFDLENCNFDSAPDTAFCIKRLLPLSRILSRYAVAGGEVLQSEIDTIISQAAEGMYHGGFHTPNHRWAIASILAGCANLLNQPKYRKRAEEYLKEGIDCNEYGEYSERSSITYNAVNNAAMITLYEETGQQQYLDFVRRNLMMMLTYLEEDGSIFSENSTRQDKGRKAYPRDYFYQFLYIAAYYNDDVMGNAACRIIEDNRRMNLQNAPDCLHYIMLSEPMQQYEFRGCEFLPEYERFYRESGVVRRKAGKMSYSLVENSSKVLFFNSGGIGLYLKLSIGYFDQRHIKIRNLEHTHDGYRFTFHADGWYYLPFEHVDGQIVDFFKVDNTTREKIVKNTVDIDMQLVNHPQGVDIRLASKGIDEVSVLLEWGISDQCEIEGDSFYTVGNAGESMLVKHGSLLARQGMDEITVTPMAASKRILKGNYGSDPQSTEHFTVYNTLTTPFDHSISIRAL